VFLASLEAPLLLTAITAVLAPMPAQPAPSRLIGLNQHRPRRRRRADRNRPGAA